MRISDRGASESLRSGIESNRALLQQLQEQITSGEKITRASQDPNAYRQKSRLEKSVAHLEQDRRLMEQSSNFLAQTDQAISQLTSNVRRLRSIVMERGNDSRGIQVSDALAGEADRLNESNVLHLNAEVSGTYLFGGHKSRSKPFTVTRSDGKIDTITYQGDNGKPPISLPGGERLNLPINGESITRGSGDDLMSLGLEIRKALTEDNFDSDGFLERLQNVEENLLLRRSQAGSALQHLEKVNDSMGERLLTLRKEYQDVAGTDLTEAITQSLSTEVSLQASMQMAARSSQLSLVNYLR